MLPCHGIEIQLLIYVDMKIIVLMEKIYIF